MLKYCKTKDIWLRHHTQPEIKSENINPKKNCQQVNRIKFSNPERLLQPESQKTRFAQCGKNDFTGQDLKLRS